MGCGSSSLKGNDFSQRPDLQSAANSEAARPQIVVSDTDNNTTKTITTVQLSQSQPPESQPPSSARKTSKLPSFNLNNIVDPYARKRPSNVAPATDDELVKATGMTRDELMAWGDKNVYRAKGGPQGQVANGPAAMVGFDAGAYGGGY
jgi:hypothetical protein